MASLNCGSGRASSADDAAAAFVRQQQGGKHMENEPGGIDLDLHLQASLGKRVARLSVPRTKDRHSFPAAVIVVAQLEHQLAGSDEVVVGVRDKARPVITAAPPHPANRTGFRAWHSPPTGLGEGQLRSSREEPRALLRASMSKSREPTNCASRRSAHRGGRAREGIAGLQRRLPARRARQARAGRHRRAPNSR